MTSMGKIGTGTRDFLIVRICAFLMLLYSLYLLEFLITGEINNFTKWNSFFESSLNKILSLTFFTAFAIHTWFGTWAIASDYLTPKIMGNFGSFAYIIFRVLVAAVIALVLTWAILIIF